MPTQAGKNPASIHFNDVNPYVHRILSVFRHRNGDAGNRAVFRQMEADICDTVTHLKLLNIAYILIHPVDTVSNRSPGVGSVAKENGIRILLSILYIVLPELAFTKAPQHAYIGNKIDDGREPAPYKSEKL